MRQTASLFTPRLDELSYTVLDLETTGGAPPEHRITEVAAYIDLLEDELARREAEDQLR